MTRESTRQYLVAIAASSVVFAFLSLYLFLRRGYYTLYIVNKAAAGTALIALGVVLLLGALSRLYKRFDPWIIYRKEFGIVALAFALLHGVISLFFLPDKFSLNYLLLNEPITFLLGLTSAILMAVLFVISFDRVMSRMNKTLWWKIQYKGARAAGFLALSHVIIMKYQGWLRWYEAGGSEELARPFLPPGSIIAGSFGIYVLLVRVLEPVLKRAAGVAVLLLTFLLVLFLTRSVLWGLQKTPAALPLRWETCKKLPNAKILELYPPICVAPDGRRAPWEPPR